MILYEEPQVNEAGLKFWRPGKYFSESVEPPDGAKPVQFSGIIATGLETRPGMEEQTRIVFAELLARLERAGLTIHHVSRIEVFCEVSLEDLYGAFNEMYAALLREAGVTLMPARLMTRARELPKGAFIEFMPDVWRAPTAS